MHKQNELEVVAQELLEKEIIFQSDLERLIGKRPFSQPTNYEAFTNGKSSGEEQRKHTGMGSASAPEESTKPLDSDSTTL